MTNERKGKNVIIGLLCATIVFMGIGFAALSSTLNITGSATIANTWNVSITDITSSTTGKASAGSPSSTATTANFSATLTEPGDTVTYTVTVRNGGNIPAELTKVTPVFTNEADDAIIYSIEEQPETDAEKKLAASASHTYKVKVTYSADAVNDKAPTTAAAKTKDFSLQLKYEQDTAA